MTSMRTKEEPKHPKYDEMVKTALVALKDRTGSSVPSIAKYLGANYTLPDNYKKTLSTQLKNMLAAVSVQTQAESHQRAPAMVKEFLSAPLLLKLQE